MCAVINISAYKFHPLEELKPLRQRLTQLCRQLQLKGTILLSTEGINLFVAGDREATEQLLRTLRAVPGLEDLAPKISESQSQPFRRMLVKIKKEIIAFGIEGIDPSRSPAPRLAPDELKRWLDEGRQFTLLDTRNDYEVRLGTFEGARPVGIDCFREFPAAVEQLPPEIRNRPIVTFCTGGIRCEKAAPYLILKGFENVFQLDGGILKYFELCGNEHYRGDCFVFDERVGLTSDLDESDAGVCHACLSPLTAAELADPMTVPGVSCPYCIASTRDSRQRELEAHREKLRQVTTPLPGQTPEDSLRPFRIAAKHAGLHLIDGLTAIFPHISREAWLRSFEAGDILNAEQKPERPMRIVQPGERYYTRERLHVEPPVNAAIEILHEDDALIVLNKPAPLPMHPSGRFNRNTLQSFLKQVYAPQKPRPAHRLDANTTGLAVFTRTAAFARILQPQFERRETEKLYLARVLGHPPQDRFICDAPILATTGLLGARVVDASGTESLTEFEVQSRLADGTALLLAKPITGRTNQIRVHLWHLGWPIVGDPMYLPECRLGDLQTLSIDAPCLNLHAFRLGFRHPQTGEWLKMEAPQPAWAIPGE